MNSLFYQVLAAGLALGHAAAAQASLPLSAADRAGIAATLARFNQNLNDHHFADMPGYVTPDISFVNVVGMYWQGEADVQRAHQAIFDRIYQHAVFQPAEANQTVWRVIASDVVLVTAQATAPSRSDVPGPAGGSTYNRSTTLLVKQQGQWRITFFQNTPVVAAATDPVRAAPR